MEDKSKNMCGCNSTFCPDNLTGNDALAVAELNKMDEATSDAIYELFDSFNIVNHQPFRDVISDYKLSGILDLFENPSWALWERQFLNV
jgi:hypothetical protein